MLRVFPEGSVCFHFIWGSLQWIVNSEDVNEKLFPVSQNQWELLPSAGEKLEQNEAKEAFWTNDDVYLVGPFSSFVKCVFLSMGTVRGWPLFRSRLQKATKSGTWLWHRQPRLTPSSVSAHLLSWTILWTWEIQSSLNTQCSRQWDWYWHREFPKALLPTAQPELARWWTSLLLRTETANCVARGLETHYLLQEKKAMKVFIDKVPVHPPPSPPLWNLLMGCVCVCADDTQFLKVLFFLWENPSYLVKWCGAGLDWPVCALLGNLQSSSQFAKTDQQNIVQKGFTWSLSFGWAQNACLRQCFLNSV